MNRDYYNRNNESGFMAAFGALMMGVIVGATAIFFSEEGNRKKLHATLNNWKDKAEETKEEIEEKAQDLKEKGLNKVSQELSKTQAEIKKRK